MVRPCEVVEPSDWWYAAGCDSPTRASCLLGGKRPGAVVASPAGGALGWQLA